MESILRTGSELELGLRSSIPAKSIERGLPLRQRTVALEMYGGQPNPTVVAGSGHSPPWIIMSSRIAYLILAHHEPAHLARLVRNLRDSRAAFFIHVDAKSDIAPFEGLARESDVWLAPTRERVFWGGLSVVKATLHLLRAATRAGRFARYCLLSGVDFPIKDRQEIARILLDTDTEFISIERKLVGAPRNDHFDNIERIHLMDSELFNRRAVPQRRLLQFLCSRSLAEAGLCLPRRSFYPGLVPYHGCAFWCLTAACVEFVLRFLTDHPDYERYHRFVRVPDEIFFHSIIKASPFAAQISRDFERGGTGGNDRGCHYIDWSAKGVRQDFVLDESDLPALLASKALFARKFDGVKSQRLMGMLEEHIQAHSARLEQ